jgi:lysophospholipase L1-like esterase
MPSNGQEKDDGSGPRPLTVFLIGDSTVKNGSGRGADGLWGWGIFLGDYLDPAKAAVQNRALGGRSSRTYLIEGLWAKVLTDLKPGDVVLIQFGHNDGGPLDTGRARASLKGVGDETKDVVPETTRKAETVHTYGWYLRKYVEDTRAKGAIPIILSPVPQNMWNDQGKVNRASKDYGGWAAEVANAEGVRFVDLNDIVAKHYEEEGKEKVESTYFTKVDHTHTSEAGARLSALSLVEGLRALPNGPLSSAFKASSGPK